MKPENGPVLKGGVVDRTNNAVRTHIFSKINCHSNDECENSYEYSKHIICPKKMEGC